MKKSSCLIFFYLAPPTIIDTSSGDTTIKEGHQLRLQCMAEGRPLPKIEWKREDGQPIRAQQNGKEN